MEEPELIGQVHHDWNYRLIAATGGDPNAATSEIGATSGYFNSTPTLKLKRTFIPEHGLIGIFSCARGDVLRTTGVLPTILDKSQPSDFWSPEYETNKVRSWSDAFWDSATTNDDKDEFRLPVFEE